MTKPVTIPNTFATATTAIPLSQLDGDFTAVATAINDANTYSNYAADTGSANAYVVTFSGVNTSYSAGLRIQFKAGNANTGASTINVNAQGAKNITYQDASALASGAIAVNSIVDVMYDGTQFLLMNDPAGATGGDVTGPASATDNAVVRFDGTTGKLVQNSAVTVADTTGDITGGKYNGLTVTTTTGTLTITNGKTLAASNTLTLAGTDSTTMTFPSTSANIARTDAGQTFTGTQVMTSPRVITSINDTNGNELFAVTATGSAVNEFTVANAATGANPVISATGSDTDIGITLTPKGTGNAVLTSGNLVVANGNGIDFSATPGTGSSELLDDYEEGTWTPVATAATAPTGVTYNFQGGWYRKIGSLVVAGFGININSVGTGGSGELKISGFPFTSATNGSYQEPSASLQGGRWVTSALAGQTYLFINDNSTVAGTRYQNNADTVISWSDVQGGNASTGTYFGSVISYHTT